MNCRQCRVLKLEIDKIMSVGTKVGEWFSCWAVLRGMLYCYKG